MIDVRRPSVRQRWLQEQILYCEDVVIRATEKACRHVCDSGTPWGDTACCGVPINFDRKSYLNLWIKVQVRSDWQRDFHVRSCPCLVIWNGLNDHVCYLESVPHWRWEDLGPTCKVIGFCNTIIFSRIFIYFDDEISGVPQLTWWDNFTSNDNSFPISSKHTLVTAALYSEFIVVGSRGCVIGYDRIEIVSGPWGWLESDTWPLISCDRADHTNFHIARETHSDVALHLDWKGCSESELYAVCRYSNVICEIDRVCDHHAGWIHNPETVYPAQRVGPTILIYLLAIEILCCQ